MAIKKRGTRGRSRSGAKRSAPVRVRKNMDMDPAKLEAVKAIFGVRTETEAVDRALKEIIFEHQVAAGLERLRSAGGLPNVDPDA
ncbi:MAG TPA: type II toxin-antitoxin system VapB family antitoxin [Gemmatimonadales bacterium]|nr:type II toxin-antitoxin system VapB family antitoxin [Gemmatimonadales bacterium]